MAEKVYLDRIFSLALRDVAPFGSASFG